MRYALPARTAGGPPAPGFCGADQNNFFGARNARRNGRHQNGGWIGRLAAGSVNSHPVQRQYALFKFNAGFRTDFVSVGNLTAVITFYAPCRRFYNADFLWFYFSQRFLLFCRCGFQLSCCRCVAVEFFHVFQKRPIARGGDIVHNFGHSCQEFR
jgi:hypothetical protein